VLYDSKVCAARSSFRYSPTLAVLVGMVAMAVSIKGAIKHTALAEDQIDKSSYVYRGVSS
jgi:hypothetical protein